MFYPILHVGPIQVQTLALDDPRRIFDLTLRLVLFCPFEFRDENVLRASDVNARSANDMQLTPIELNATEFAILLENQVCLPSGREVDDVELQCVLE